MNSAITQFEMLCDALMDDDLYLEHYGRSKSDGALVGSGRYPLGSGEKPYQHELDFYNMVRKMRKEGMSYTDIAKANSMTTTEFRKKWSNASSSYRKDRDNTILELSKKGYTYRKIAEETGLPGSTVRKVLNPDTRASTNKNQEIADKLRDYLTDHDMVDIGPGTELALGCTRNRITNAAAILEESGDYKVHQVWVPQMTGRGKTNITTIAPADWDYNKDILPNADKIFPITDTVIDVDGSVLVGKAMKPASVDSKRIFVKYAEDGGNDFDGEIQIRRGCEDLNLGNNHYAQVRIAVDGTHYLKGVACYSDDIPDGYDIVLPTNKHKGTPLLGDEYNSVAKPMKNDPSNPFGSSIKEEGDLRMTQKYYFDKNGVKQTSALNYVNEEGAWEGWSKAMSSQALSKQSEKLAKQQLDLTLMQAKNEFEEIKSLTCPTVKKKLLEDYAENSDAAARDLKAAPFAGQHNRVLRPIKSMSDNECYCEDYENGTHVYLIRHPFATTAECPELVVNNNNKEAKKKLGGAVDCIGINKHVADQMSGADFDGDAVVVVPKTSNSILSTKKPFKELQDFDTKSYKLPDDDPRKLTKKREQIEMGMTSNLITDMTLKGAKDYEIVDAVKASMVVIDARKHHLDYKQAYKDCHIDHYKRIYQFDEETGKYGAPSTLISRAKHEVDVPERYSRTGTYRTNTDPETGAKIWKNTDRYYTDYKVDKKTGKVTIKEGVKAMQKSHEMDETPDARTLSSGTKMESIYADYANGRKALANAARKEYLNTPRLKTNAKAKEVYSEEVQSLERKLTIAKKNAPLERKAVTLAGAVYNKAVGDNPDMSKEDRKKLRGRLMVTARDAVGAKKTRVNISNKEWEAIQAGAISENMLTQILNNADMDRVRELATPRQAKRGLMPTQVALVKTMQSRGYTREEIAERMNVSVSTINNALIS